MAIQGLPSGNRARVYKLIADELITDPTLTKAVKVWDTGLGNTGQHISPNAATATHIRLTPLLGPVQWYSPDSQLGNLQIKVEILATGAVAKSAVGGIDMLDVLNLWEAIENAFYPLATRSPGDDDAAYAAKQGKARDRQLDFEKRLQCAGSHTGQITFSQPATFQGTDSESGNPIAVGMMQVDVIRAFSP